MVAKAEVGERGGEKAGSERELPVSAHVQPLQARWEGAHLQMTRRLSEKSQRTQSGRQVARLDALVPRSTEDEVLQGRWQHPGPLPARGACSMHLPAAGG